MRRGITPVEKLTNPDGSRFQYISHLDILHLRWGRLKGPGTLGA